MCECVCECVSVSGPYRPSPRSRNPCLSRLPPIPPYWSGNGEMLHHKLSMGILRDMASPPPRTPPLWVLPYKVIFTHFALTSTANRAVVKPWLPVRTLAKIEFYGKGNEFKEAIRASAAMSTSSTWIPLVYYTYYRKTPPALTRSSSLSPCPCFLACSLFSCLVRRQCESLLILIKSPRRWEAGRKYATALIHPGTSRQHQ